MWTTTSPERRQWNINLNGYADLDFENIVDPKDSVSLSKFNAKLRGKKYYD